MIVPLEQLRGIEVYEGTVQGAGVLPQSGGWLTMEWDVLAGTQQSNFVGWGLELPLDETDSAPLLVLRA